MITQNLVEIANPHWQDKALCNGADPALFFDGAYAAAKRFCQACPVKAQCLEWILKLESELKQLPQGVYAGYTASERSRMKLCLLEGCYKPRIIIKTKRSRYCSEEHQAEQAKRNAKAAAEREKIRSGSSLNPHVDNREYHMRGKIA